MADWYNTDIHLESAYSGVVTFRALILVDFLVELNGLWLWATDIGNVSKTKEKV